ncbi:MAG: uridine diphosphate-N-acetylglucosamine-binding protein YvcK [Nocardioidaceae bacterium]|nr:uridine diphosphate-N-acetylglucosamine-binding protein YvcK [Nocardioidaceae bacterium]
MSALLPSPAELAGVATPAVVALGGGHGLAASLSALRHVTSRLTAVVTVADNGGSSGRLRRELGVLPPGDLRMALAALCGDDAWGRTWASALQHRFASDGELNDHALGNLLIVTLWQLLGDGAGGAVAGTDPHVAGLDWVARLLGAGGRVLPMSAVPLDVVAQVRGVDSGRPGRVTQVRGQVEVASTTGQVESVALDPPDPPGCAEALTAVREADCVVIGPGSWFTSVLPHLLVPSLSTALHSCRAKRVLTLNLAPQSGETAGFSPEAHVEMLAAHAPDLRIDTVLADAAHIGDDQALRSASARIGATLVLADVAERDGSPRHDVLRLAAAYREVCVV